MRNAGAFVLLVSTAALCACTEPNPLYVPTASPCEVGRVVIEPFDLAVSNRVDILFVVDNSPGMAPAQAALSAAMPEFVEALNANADLDYQLGVTSTDVISSTHQGRLQTGIAGQPNCPGERPSIITSDTPSGPTVAACNVVLGESGDDYEAGLEAARYALLGPAAEPGGENEGFLREDSRFVAIIFSTEDDCSDGGALARQNPNECEWDRDLLMSLDTYVGAEGFFRLIRSNDGNPVDVVTIVGPDDGRTFDEPEAPEAVCAGNGLAFNGRRYRAVVEAMGDRGGAYNVCTTGYESMLSQVLDEHILPRPQHICPTLTLTQEPVSVGLVADDSPLVPVSNDGAGYLYLGSQDDCVQGEILIAPQALDSLGSSERLEVHYCTDDPLP
jgi:hypothetical protein